MTKWGVDIVLKANLNPTPFPWEKQISEKSVFLDIFQKLSSKSQNQVHSHLWDVPVGLTT